MKKSSFLLPKKVFVPFANFHAICFLQLNFEIHEWHNDTYGRNVPEILL